MSDCLCDVCKKQMAKIQITGQGKYCLDCHNDIILKKFGIEDTFQYAPTMAVMEPSGAMHTFRVEHVILGRIVSWDAYEIDGEYHFKEISDIENNGAAVARKFFQKIVEGVCTKTIDEVGYPSLTSEIERTSTEIKDKGTIFISEDEDIYGRASFVIDGKKYSGEELAELFSAYPGFMLHYQIHDASEPILKEDEYLMPVRITKQSLIDELEVAINIHGDRGFISYKDTLAFDEAFYKIIEKLEVFHNSDKKEDALAAGRKMVQILADTETDDDYFPRYNIEVICKTVDPFGIDEELKQIVQEWEDSF